MPREGLFRLIYKHTNERMNETYARYPREYPPFGSNGWFFVGGPKTLELAQAELDRRAEDLEQYNETDQWKIQVVRVG